MGAKKTSDKDEVPNYRSRDYINLTWGQLEKKFPKAIERFNEWYSVLSYAPGWDWIRIGPGDRPFTALPFALRMGALLQFCIDYNLFPSPDMGEQWQRENLYEQELGQIFNALEERLKL